VAFFVGNRALLGPLGSTLRLRARPNLLIEQTRRQSLWRKREGRMHHQATLSATDRSQSTGRWMMGVVEKGGVLSGQDERMGGHAFERALLVRQQDLGWQRTLSGEKRVGRLGILPIGAGLIDRRGGLRPEGFRHDQQPSIQACVAEIQSVELPYTPSCINTLGRYLLLGEELYAWMPASSHQAQGTPFRKIPVTVRLKNTEGYHS
jgi:hypothetical protein